MENGQPVSAIPLALSHIPARPIPAGGGGGGAGGGGAGTPGGGGGKPGTGGGAPGVVGQS